MGLFLCSYLAEIYIDKRDLGDEDREDKSNGTTIYDNNIESGLSEC